MAKVAAGLRTRKVDRRRESAATCKMAKVAAVHPQPLRGRGQPPAATCKMAKVAAEARRLLLPGKNNPRQPAKWPRLRRISPRSFRSRTVPAATCKMAKVAADQSEIFQTPNRARGTLQNGQGCGGSVRDLSDAEPCPRHPAKWRSEEHTSELQSRFDIVCRLL